MIDLNDITFIRTLIRASTAFMIASKEAKAGGLCCFSSIYITPKFLFGRDETLQHSHKEFDNVINIWYFKGFKN